MYRVVSLGTLGGNQSQAMALNQYGVVVGWAHDTNQNQRAFAWVNGNMSELSPLTNYETSVANDINDEMWIVGYSDRTNESFEEHATLWTNGIPVDLGTLGGRWSKALSVNNRGTITGYSEPSNKTHNAIVWQGTHRIEVYPFNDSEEGRVKYSWARDINEHEQVIGRTHLYTGWGEAYRPFIWEDFNTNYAYDYPGEMDVLGTLGGWNGDAWSINEGGQVTGYTYMSNEVDRHMFLVTPTNGIWKDPTPNTWWTNALMVDLGVLSNGTFSMGYAINDYGTMVGFSETTPGGSRHAVIADAQGMVDLNTLLYTNTGWTLEEARDINNAGEIVGFGTLTDGFQQAFLLIPLCDDLRIVREERTYDGKAHHVRWTATFTDHYYAVDHAFHLQASEWTEIEPTNQWPVIVPSWHGSVTGETSAGFFRVRGIPVE